MPWRSAFARELHFPCSVLGPLLFCALARLAPRIFSVTSRLSNPTKPASSPIKPACFHLRRSPRHALGGGKWGSGKTGKLFQLSFKRFAMGPFALSPFCGGACDGQFPN